MCEEGGWTLSTQWMYVHLGTGDAAISIVDKCVSYEAEF